MAMPIATQHTSTRMNIPHPLPVGPSMGPRNTDASEGLCVAERKSRHTCHSHLPTLLAKTVPVQSRQLLRRSIVFDILHRVGIKASPDKVYKSLATPEGVAGWWTTETTGDRKTGGMIKFRFTDHGRELGVFDMKILELHPD